MTDRLEVKFEKGAGGVVTTARGELATSYPSTFLGTAFSDITPMDNIDDTIITVPSTVAECLLMLTSAECSSEFTGRRPFLGIHLSRIVWVRVLDSEATS